MRAMMRLLMTTTAALLTTAPVWAQEADAAAEAEQSPMLTIDDIMSLKSVGAPQISPDGRWIAYTVRETDMEKDRSRTRIWMIPADGGEPIAMTAEDQSAGNPKWSPDNKYLAFTASRGDKAKTQVWTLNRVGGEAMQLTHVKQGVRDFHWSPDGARLLLEIRDIEPKLADDDKENDDKPQPHVIDRIQFKQDYVGYLDRRRVHLYTFSPGDEEPVQVTFGDYEDRDPVWSPDGARVAFVSNRDEDPDISYNDDIWVVAVDADDKTPQRMTANPGRDVSPQWTADGRRLVYVMSEGPDLGGSALTPSRHIAVTTDDPAAPRILTASLDHRLSSPRLSANGRSVYFQMPDRGRNHLAEIGLNGRGFQRVIDGPVSVSGYDVEAGMLVARVSGPARPGELFAASRGRLTRLTEVNEEILGEKTLGAVEKIQFESADGTPIEAFVAKPPDFEPGRRYPTLLWLHGGPAAQYTYGFNTTAQLFAANGYVVVMPNPRGSIGYGEDFAQATAREWGEKDYDDVMAAVDYVIDQGLADADRLGVAGWSYGGILTNHVLVRTDRFKAAMSGASIGNAYSNYGNDHYQIMYHLGWGAPWVERERWDALSPFFRVENIMTPTLWMGGAIDWNVPIINSEQMYLAMKYLGRETQMVVYPNEHHGIRRPSFQKDRYERWLAWFDAHLK